MNSKTSPSFAVMVEGSKVLEEVAVILMVVALARYARAKAERRLLMEGILYVCKYKQARRSICKRKRKQTLDDGKQEDAI